MITVTYRSVDGCKVTATEPTLAGAQKFAHYYVGPHPEIGRMYAISGDGVGRITVQGCTLQELFPST